MDLFSGRNFFWLVGRLDDFVKGVNEGVNVDAVSGGALLDGFKLGDVAAEAAHTGVQKNLNRLGILLNDLDDIHILSNFHKKSLLKRENYSTKRGGVK